MSKVQRRYLHRDTPRSGDSDITHVLFPSGFFSVNSGVSYICTIDLNDDEYFIVFFYAVENLLVFFLLRHAPEVHRRVQ